MSRVLLIIWLVVLTIANVAILAILVWVVALFSGWIRPFKVEQWVRENPGQPKPEMVAQGVSTSLVLLAILVIVVDLAAVILTVANLRRNQVN